MRACTIEIYDYTINGTDAVFEQIDSVLLHDADCNKRFNLTADNCTCTARSLPGEDERSK